MKAPALLLLALGVAFAGCLAPAEQGPDVPSADGDRIAGREAVSGPPFFTLSGCTGLREQAVFQAGAVAAQLPGYRPGSLAGNDQAVQVQLWALTCDVAVGDESYAKVPLGWTGILVFGVPEEVASSGDDYYVFEWLLPREAAPALADWLVADGWTVREVTYQESPTGVAFLGEVDYRIVPAAAMGTGPVPFGGVGGKLRMHHGPGPGHVFMDLESEFDSLTMTGSVLQATAGSLAAMAPAGGGAPGDAVLGVTLAGDFTRPSEP